MKAQLLAAALVISATGPSSISTDQLVIGNTALVYHPDNFIESTGSLIIRRGDLGFRAIGADGMNAYVIAADNERVGFAVYPDHLGNSRDMQLAIVGGGTLEFSGVETEESLYTGERYMHARINGEDVIIPFYAASP